MRPLTSLARSMAAMLLAALAWLGSPAPASAQTTLTVTSLLDDGSVGTLRSVIQNINVQCVSALAGPFTVTFGVAGSIDLLGTQGPLPVISCNGTKLVGSVDGSGLPLVFINGQALLAGPNPVDGLSFAATTSGNEVSGLAVGNFAGVGIRMASSGSRVAGSLVGVQRDGETAAGNQQEGIILGPGSTAEGNIVGANQGPGIRVVGDDAVIQNNRIGLSRSEAALGNASAGLIVGATLISANETPSARTRIINNTIGANGASGIDVGAGPNTLIQGNFIGLNNSGIARANGSWGVLADFSQGVKIGGAGAGERNVIAFNRLCGVAAASQSTTDEAVEISRNEIYGNAKVVGATRGIARFNCSDPAAAMDPNPLPKNFAAPTPGIASVKYSGVGGPGTTITWRAAGLPVTTEFGSQVTVEFFGNPSAANGFDQGESFAGSCPPATVDGVGNATCTSPRIGGLVANPTATATRTVTVTQGTFPNTSEFTAALITPTASVGNLSVSLGPVAVGARSTASTVTFTNPSTLNLTVSSIVSSDAAEFVIDSASTTCQAGTAPTVLAPNQSCVLGVVLAPQNSGARSGTVTLELTDTQTGTQFSFELAANGTGIGAVNPALTLAPASLTFGTVALGLASAAQRVTVTNTGAATVTLANPALAAPTHFVVTATTCAPGPLAVAAACTIDISFQPRLASSLTGTLALNSTDAGSFAVTMSGTGQGQAVALDFGLSTTTAKVGDTAELTLSIRNDNAAPVLGFSGSLQALPASLSINGPPSAISGAGCSGSLAGNPALTLTGVTLPANGSCTFTVPIQFGSPGPVSYQQPAGAVSGTVLDQVIANAASNALSLAVGPPNLIAATLATVPATGILGERVRVVYGFDNPNAAPFAANGNFQAVVPAGLPLAAPANTALTAGCGGVATPTSTGVTVSGLVIPTGGRCELAFDVVSSQTGQFTFQIAAGSLVGVILSAPASNAAAAPLTLSITRAPQAILVVSPPGPIAFGSAQVGAVSAPVTVTLTNVGGRQLVFAPGAIAISGDFRILSSSTCTGASLDVLPNPTAECVLNIAFAPQSVSSSVGVLSIASSGGGANLSLSGTGVAAPVPDIAVTPASIDFGPQQVGAASPASRITVINQGTAPLVISRLLARGDFGFTSDCNAAPLPSQAACRVDAVFSPLVPGPRVGGITLSSNDPDAGQLEITLRGEGVAAPAALIALSPASIAFPDTVIGQRSPAASSTLTNIGTAPLTVSGISVAGQGFEVAQSCIGALPPGGSCTITAQFLPTAASAFAADVLIASDAPGSPAILPLTGRGVVSAAGELVSEPASLAFGDQAVQTASGPKPVLIRNVGSRTVVVAAIGTTGDYQVSGACARLEPQGSCALTVTFTPQAIGERAGSVVIASDAGNAALRIPATGRGIADPAPRLSLSATSIDFGNTLVGFAASRAISLTNTGDSTLALGSLAIDGDLTVRSDCPSALAPGSLCTLTVGFQPRTAGARGGTVAISSNDPASPARIGVSGTGCRFGLTGRGFALLCTP